MENEKNAPRYLDYVPDSVDDPIVGFISKWDDPTLGGRYPSKDWHPNACVFPGSLPENFSEKPVRKSSFFELGRYGKVIPARSKEDHARLRAIRRELRGLPPEVS